MLISRRSRLSLRAAALLYLTLLLLAPLGVVFYRTFEHGVGTAWAWMTTPAAISAFWLSILVAVIAVPLNTVFGVGAALVIARSKVPGRGLLDALIDLPFVVSPVIVGLALVLVYGETGWFGDWFRQNGIQIIFADIESDAPQAAAALSVVLLSISLVILLVLRRLGGRVAH